MQKAYVFMLSHRGEAKEVDETYLKTYAEFSAYWAELRGLAFAIKDEDLLKLVNTGYDLKEGPDRKRNLLWDEVQIRGTSQRIHTRIAQLLEAATEKRKWR